MAEENKSTTPEQSTEQVVKTYSEQEYNALAEQLRNANDTIQSYKDMDIDGIKKSVEEYKQKAEQAENDRKAFEHRTKLSQYVKGLRLKDDIYEAHVTKLLEEKELKFDGDKLIGGDDVVRSFRKDHEDAFIPDSEERATAPTSGKAPQTMSAVEQAFYAKNPQLVPRN